MALSFNGIDQYLQQSSVVTGVPVSFACWYHPSDLSAFRNIISIGSKTANNGLFSVTQLTQNLRSDSHANGTSAFSDSTASLSNGVWFHCVSVFGSPTSRLNYLNGVASTVNSVSNVPVGLTVLCVGAGFAGPSAVSFASGLIAYPAVWNTVLSPSDVTALYNSGAGSDPNNVETANLRSFSYFQGLPYVDIITSTAWTVTGSPVVVADPFTLTPPTTSVFPVSIDSFKRIPSPTTTATNLADSTDDTLSTRLQKHSDAIVATETYVFSHKGTPFNILDFGADPTGVTDSTTAIQSACTIGGSVFFPAGTYKISGTINLTNPGTYFGSGTSSTIITSTSTTADLFNIGISGVHIVGMQLTASVTRTGGYHVNTTVGGFFDVSVRDFLITGLFNGIHCLNWVAPSCVRDGYILGGSSSGNGVVIEGETEPLIDNVLFEGSTNTGIYIPSCFSATINNCLFGTSSFGIVCQPVIGSTVNVEAVLISNCIFDSLITYGVYLNSTVSGLHISSVRLMGVWFATMAVGFITQTSSGGIINMIQIIGCNVYNCTSHGIAIVDSGASDFLIRDSVISGNGTAGPGLGSGIYAGPGVSSFSIIGCKSGTLNGVIPNSRFGIELMGTNTNFIIMGNDLRGNTLGEQFGTGTGTFVNANNI